MRKGTIILLLLFFVYTTQAQVKSSDELVHKIFASLQAKDENAFLSLCPDSAQLVRIMKRLAQGVILDVKSDLPKDFSRSSMASLDKSLEPLRSSLRKTYSPKEIQKLIKGFKESFNSIIKDGEKRGLDWATAVLTNYAFDSAKAYKFLYNQSISKNSGYQSFRGKIFFKDGGSACQLWFGDMLSIAEENNWYGGTLEMLVREGDKADIVEVRDVVLQNIIEEPPPPPPPPKLKKKKSVVKKKQRPKS